MANRHRPGRLGARNFESEIRIVDRRFREHKPIPATRREQVGPQPRRVALNDLQFLGRPEKVMSETPT